MKINLKKIQFYFLFSCIVIITCTNENKRINYVSQRNYPLYPKEFNNNYSLTKKAEISNIPLNVSSYSFYSLKEDVENRVYPSGILTEELLNSFPYNYPIENEKKLNVYTEVATCPWQSQNKLVHIGIHFPMEEENPKKDTPSKNVIFAVDTSGSMQSNNAMNLAKKYMNNILPSLDLDTYVGIVQYTDEAKIILKPTQLKARNKIQNIIESLDLGGGTNAWPGILLAYKLSNEMKKKETQTEIIVISDGDFGGVNNEEFITLANSETKKGTNISIICLGTNLRNVEIMDIFSKRNIGYAAYVRSDLDIKKNNSIKSRNIHNIYLENAKANVKFNSALVSSYKLLGFEKFELENEKSNFEIFPGFSYTAIYEIEPVENVSTSDILGQINISFKTSKGKQEEVKQSIKVNTNSAWEASENFRFAAGVAGLGLLLNKSPQMGNLDYYMVIHLLQNALNYDPDGSKKELFQITNKLKE